MPRITLNTYVQEVASLIDREARDEAIGHCKHILESFPKHLKTYNLLGKALYERSLTTDAADVFKRILAAVPDDREAHLYLCEIYSETDLNASIFHLERVWEHSPEDVTIQDELKKLYAKRDGEAPLTLQMTAPALARRYFNGRLYAEAAAELEKLLERFPARHDLRGLLAQTLWADDRPDEATEVALQVLAELPDHLEANRIMATLWLLMQRPSDARPFVNRLQALDPYLAWKVVYGEDVRVPENAFLLERLDWRAKSAALALDVSGMGEVFSSLDALTLSDSSLPDYTAAPKPATGRLAQAARQNAPEADLPDWLDDAPQAAAAFTMPDWSQDYAEQTEDVPDWLVDDVPAARPSAAADWLADDDFAADIPQAEWLIDDVPDSAPATDLPDWLSDAPQPAPGTSADDLLDAMAWLMTGTLTPPAEERPQAAVGTDFEADFDFESLAAASSAPTAQPVTPLESDFDFGMFDAAGTPDLSVESTESAPAAALPTPEGEDAAFNLDWLSGTPDLSVESTESAPVAALPDSSTAFGAETDQSSVGLDWLASPIEGDEQAPDNLDWLAEEPAQPDAMPVLEDSELAAIEADPLAWMADFGLSPVPEPSTPQADLDATDLAEFEAQRASTDDQAAFEVLLEADSTAEGAPQSVAQIAGEMTAEAMLAWLQENTPTPEQIEAEGRAMLSREAEEIFDLPRLTPSAAELPAPDSIELEDDWLTSFESAAAQPPSLSVPSSAAAETPAWLDAQPEADEVLADSPEWLISAEQSTGQTGLLAAEADQAFDQLLEQARNANTPRKIGDTGILSPDAMPDWLSAFDADAPLDAIGDSTTATPQTAEWLSESLADLALPELEPSPEPDALPDAPNEPFTPSWLGETPEQTVESALADLWDSAPLASLADLADTTEAPPSTAEPEAEDEPMTFTFRKPPVWKRKRSSGVE